MRRLARRLTLLLGVTTVLFACSDPSGPPDGTPSVSWKSVAAGANDSCAISEAGEPYCWGEDLLTPCGGIQCEFRSRPALVPGAPAAFDSVTSGGGFHCGIAGTEAFCWGQGGAIGSLGDGQTGSSREPVHVIIPGRVRSISAGYRHACVLSVDGDAYCWGDATGGKLGRTAAGGVSAEPGLVVTSLKFASITAGTAQTCAVTPDGVGYCWGTGSGSLGVGDRDPGCATGQSCLATNQPMEVDGDHRWSMISAGNGFTCGVTIEHRGFCWGEVDPGASGGLPYGALGSGQLVGSKAPLPVAGDHEFTSIAAGARHACGLTTDGAAWCWGNNTLAEMGLGTVEGRYATPQRVPGNHQFVSIAAAGHTCGITVDAAMYCWGDNTLGRVGVGKSAFAPVRRPTRVVVPVP